MSDLSQILLLPPPTPPLQRQSTTAREQDLPANPDVQQQGGDAARGRRFRFRVYEGDQANTDIATRRTDPRTTLIGNGSAEDATSQPSSGRIRYATADSRNGASSAFLAQAFAQEQLGEGLHNPPYAAASAAYSRTGAAAYGAGTGTTVSLSV